MGSLEVLKAYNGDLITKLDMIDKKSVEKVLESAQKAFLDKSQHLSKVQRLKILKALVGILTKRREEIALLAASEGGKPLVDSLIEVDRGIEGVELAIEELGQIKGQEIAMGHTEASKDRMAYTTFKPLGVILAVSAFNHPFNLIIHQVIPAVAVGCPVIVKPAMTTPLSCRLLVEALYEAGLPKVWCQMVICENDVAEVLVTSDKISFMTFIGSSKVGWYLRSKLAPGVRCALEHGGAAPAIVDESANLVDAVKKLTRGGFYHSGQVCVSVQRVLLDKRVSLEFTKMFVESVKKLVTGDPEKKETDLGPLILPREVDRVEEWVNEAVQEGAKVLCGGKRISDTCFEPTVLLNPSAESKVSQKEIFGPVVCLYEYDDFSTAIERANAVEYAFQSSVFTNKLDQAYEAVEGLEGMALMVNDHTAFRVDWMPFGGYKSSGLGVGGIGHSMKDLLIEKMFVWNK